MVRLVVGTALLLLILWGSGSGTADSKEPQKNAVRPIHRTAANTSPR
ncbi:MAG: hypothetical protein HZA03_08220 [Nitrospinae bacterium]|nr:hypothetical protein [Nitrospinota bacterium]